METVNETLVWSFVVLFFSLMFLFFYLKEKNRKKIMKKLGLKNDPAFMPGDFYNYPHNSFPGGW